MQPPARAGAARAGQHGGINQADAAPHLLAEPAGASLLLEQCGQHPLQPGACLHEPLVPAFGGQIGHVRQHAPRAELAQRGLAEAIDEQAAQQVGG